MKKLTLIITLFWLLNACSSQANSPTKKNQDVISSNSKNCPQVTTVANIKINPEDIYSAFNYQIHKIIPKEDTIIFQSINHDFVLCKGNKTWTIQPSTLEKPSLENEEQAINNLANPPYETIELNGEKYQYRTILEPNPFPNFDQPAQKVIFELILPNSQQPQRQVIYTLEQVTQANTGIQLGFPAITKALVYDNRIFWAISPEQGEGNGGIATIVNYNPKTQEFLTIQPPEIQGQQINDLAIAGNPNNPTFWIATQQGGEGNPYLPSMGLVAYQPNSSDYKTGTIKVYNMRNSPIVGAIPNQLYLDNNILWIGTGNGICELIWQAADQTKNWQCWRYSLQAKVPAAGLALYPSVLASNSLTNLTPNQNPEIEVLWWSQKDFNTNKGRYEIVYNPGLTVELTDQDNVPWSEYFETGKPSPIWGSPLYWIGWEWYWQGERFIRGLDAVALNYVGGGPQGIAKPQENYEQPRDYNAIRGDLELINLTKNSTTIKHFSAWVDDSLIQPYLGIVPSQYTQNSQPNPLDNFLKQNSSQETGSLPKQVLENLRQNLAEKEGIDPASIQVIESSQQTWPDGCLGLAKPEEFCTQQLIEGWRVTLSDGGNNTWVYRTDQKGNIFRLEK